ncbi:uncharacterized protein PHACADRAFT_265800 [Phanerochaete carnosa HHB-10118-sp]|uniref:Cytochrome P450 n=1 Tax=Phanerochaete carnosa (strain HHB-10118-sp) TaxID=650164 RepID=K5UHY8_PHACS|nr:uncharacterized protein PHACADRAFT_265800 [Phanerochaete carnosa HHB-10118-sp]EKM49141.1 hypothetical protein PHACADRAFT_265800 [Phanerochaete carnosa HHB-10118-sp]
MSVHLVPTLLPALAALLLLSYIVLRLRYRFPPGPKGLPIIGNVFDVRKPFQWLIYQEWSREHSIRIVLRSMTSFMTWISDRFQYRTF